MRSENTIARKEWTIEDQNTCIIDAIQDIKGKDIVLMDLRGIDAPTDFFIICQGDSTTQVNAIAENVKLKMRENLQLSPSFIEGKGNGLWVLVDYFNTVVHIFHKDKRDFYMLEELWSDAIVTKYENV